MATTRTALASNSELKHPGLQLGQKMVRGNEWERDFPFYLEQYALHLIRRYRSIGNKHGRIPEHNKHQIRECLRIFSEATQFEIAGIYVDHGFNLDSTDFNACYVAGVRGAASPPSYGVQLLIRFKKDDANLALITGTFGLSDYALKPA